MNWTLAPNGRHLQRDGSTDFLLADTHWAGLHRAATDGWAEMVRTRARQSFNAVLVSLLPIGHDRSGELHLPFDDEAGEPVLERFSADFLERARHRLDVAHGAGLTPVILLSWVDWLPGTWADGGHARLSLPQLMSLTRQAVAALDGFEPIWCLSGDDTMTSPEAVEYYRATARLLRELSPTSLIGAHTGAFVNLPQALLEAIDFVGYQSGHDGPWRTMPQSFNRHLAARTPRRLGINLEAVYEGHGHGQGAGRHGVENVLRASWNSVVTGGGAGLGYGAHGLWNWHRRGDAFTSVEWSSMPFDAMDALRLPGAEHMGWLRRMALELRLWELDDRSDLIQDDRSGAVTGATVELDRVVVHAPEAAELRLIGTGQRVRGWSIPEQRECVVDAWPEAGGRQLHIGVPREMGAHLYVIER